jgi:UDP-glucose 4-epimerase
LDDARSFVGVGRSEVRDVDERGKDIDDCVHGIYRVVDSFDKAKGTTFNIASGEGSSLVELAEAIVASLDVDVDIHIEPNRTGEVGRYVADIDKARKVLGYEPEVSFGEGIDRTVDWYTAHEQFFDVIL